MGKENQVTDDLRIRFSTAARQIPHITGESVHVSAIHRWATRGLAGVKLRTEYAGGHKRTTMRWIRQFFAEVTAAKTGEPVRADTKSSSQSRQEKARKELEAAGI
ncbi:hypothetical protein Q31b_42300 [Novipirellula aureliae]|uniref:Uncharacterized protein n=2 Tax=Novipirellula aureliae TaxID=2527966 RepID=A0A5C6DSB5_9BACT|nr:hypothetical protein Q31b_42300 [Novipirellula aureliae]